MLFFRLVFNCYILNMTLHYINKSSVICIVVVVFPVSSASMNKIKRSLSLEVYPSLQHFDHTSDKSLFVSLLEGTLQSLSIEPLYSEMRCCQFYSKQQPNEQIFCTLK